MSLVEANVKCMANKANPLIQESDLDGPKTPCGSKPCRRDGMTTKSQQVMEKYWVAIEISRLIHRSTW